MSNSDEHVLLAKCALTAQRYDDMVTSMKTLVESNIILNDEERDLFSLAYKQVLGKNRVSWRRIVDIESKGVGSEYETDIIIEYREKIEKEIKDLCHEVLILLDKYLIPKVSKTDSKVFYLKMKGDYYRYLAEVATDVKRKELAEESLCAYKDGYCIAKEQMLATHPFRLGLALNLSVLYYEILEQQLTAYRLAKKAFNDCIVVLDNVEDTSHQDAIVIMQVIRDNLDVWGREKDELDNTGETEEKQ